MEAFCCSEFKKARKSGTDSEGYGALIWCHPKTWDYTVGCGLEPITYCPWCGIQIGKAHTDIQMLPRVSHKERIL